MVLVGRLEIRKWLLGTSMILMPLSDILPSDIHSKRLFDSPSFEDMVVIDN